MGLLGYLEDKADAGGDSDTTDVGRDTWGDVKKFDDVGAAVIGVGVVVVAKAGSVDDVDVANAGTDESAVELTNGVADWLNDVDGYDDDNRADVEFKGVADVVSNNGVVKLVEIGVAADVGAGAVAAAAVVAVTDEARGAFGNEADAGSPVWEMGMSRMTRPRDVWKEIENVFVLLLIHKSPQLLKSP